MGNERGEAMRMIPQVDAVAEESGLAEWVERAGRGVVVEAARSAVERLRAEISGGKWEGLDRGSAMAKAVEYAAQETGRLVEPQYRRAINATGIILHTALGRAVLAGSAVRRIAEELSGYSVLQADVETGKRSRRDGRIEGLLRRLTGAEAATLVNNNAAATMLVLNTVAAGREVIVSRGQLVEIGGSFRLPEVMEASGARLVEVGATNRTHARDYERAIGEETAAIMRVHPSNYRIEGFSSEVGLGELERIAHSRGLVLIDDVGAGSIVDFSRFGFGKEPTLPESVAVGADVVTSSLDKMMGGCQGGVIVGKKELIERVRRNPMARAMRVGKMTLAAAEATLVLFLDERKALEEVPTLVMATRGIEEIGREARRIARDLKKRRPAAKVEVIDGYSQMGSGSLPGQEMPTKLVSVEGDGLGADELAARLRGGRPAVFTRIQKGNVLIDPRTLLAGETKAVVEAVAGAMEAGGE